MAEAVDGAGGEGEAGIGDEVDMAIKVVMEIIKVDMDITKVDMVVTKVCILDATSSFSVCWNFYPLLLIIGLAICLCLCNRKWWVFKSRPRWWPRQRMGVSW